LVVLINERVVSDKVINKAVRQALRGLLHGGDAPQGCVLLTLDPASVDINVHPQKSEVRFADSQYIFRFVYGGVARALSQLSGVPQVSLQSIQGTSQRSPVATALPLAQNSVVPFKKTESSFGHTQTLHHPIESRSSNYALQSVEAELPRQHSAPVQFSALRYIGTLGKCYLLCESDNGLVMVDMHAAHERISYNRFVDQVKRSATPQESLLFPLEVQVPVLHWERAQLYPDELTRCGFTFEFPRSGSICVTTIPRMLVGKKDLGSVVREVVESLEEGIDGIRDRLVDSIAARLACHASVRSGDTLTETEVYALFSDLDCADLGAACPHGRPVAVNVTLPELERLFGRA